VLLPDLHSRTTTATPGRDRDRFKDRIFLAAHYHISSHIHAHAHAHNQARVNFRSTLPSAAMMTSNFASSCSAWRSLLFCCCTIIFCVRSILSTCSCIACSDTTTSLLLVGLIPLLPTAIGDAFCTGGRSVEARTRHAQHVHTISHTERSRHRSAPKPDHHQGRRRSR
jgi:hypothetical protein